MGLRCRPARRKCLTSRALTVRPTGCPGCMLNATRASVCGEQTTCFSLERVASAPCCLPSVLYATCCIGAAQQTGGNPLVSRGTWHAQATACLPGSVCAGPACESFLHEFLA